MQITNEALIAELQQITDSAIVITKKFKALSLDALNAPPAPQAWSILQCLEHLNLYGDFYLPEMEKQILQAEKSGLALSFQSGFLGNYFASLMRAKQGKIKKMKSPKDKAPASQNLSITTLDRFLKQQDLLHSLLLQAKQVNLTKTKASISLSKWIKLRLGDTFRFYVYHIERHIGQAERAAQKVASGKQLAVH